MKTVLLLLMLCLPMVTDAEHQEEIIKTDELVSVIKEILPFVQDIETQLLLFQCYVETSANNLTHSKALDILELCYQILEQHHTELSDENIKKIVTKIQNLIVLLDQEISTETIKSCCKTKQVNNLCVCNRLRVLGNAFFGNNVAIAGTLNINNNVTIGDCTTGVGNVIIGGNLHVCGTINNNDGLGFVTSSNNVPCFDSLTRFDGNATTIITKAPLIGPDVQGTQATAPLVADDCASPDLNLALLVKGNGALITNIPDNNPSGGNSRGSRAVDLQSVRNAATQVASGIVSFIGNGFGNTASSVSSFVGGGFTNTSSNFSSAVVGGTNNTASGNSSFIGGGNNNLASGDDSVLCGGQNNQALGFKSFVGSGVNNIVSGIESAICGGQQNNATVNDVFIGAGIGNTASGDRSNIVGGRVNVCSGTSAFIGAGDSNIATENLSNIVGGDNNTNNGGSAIIGAGARNIINAFGGDSGIFAGSFNTISNSGAFIGAGNNNTASGPASSIVAGDTNQATAPATFIGAGHANQATFERAAVVAGFENLASGGGSFIGSGANNVAGGNVSVVVGGTANQATSDGCFVGGGNDNQAIGTTSSFVGAGNGNISSGFSSVVCGGTNNEASNTQATIGGGNTNLASGVTSCIPGGDTNIAAGDWSFAAGRFAQANDQGSFVWADSSGSIQASTGNDTVTIRASGGTTIYSEPTSTFGVNLPTNGAAWVGVSNREAKENFEPVDTVEVLKKLAAIPLESWNYKAQHPSIRHIGPMAQDFNPAFGFTETPLGISTLDADGVALAAIQGMYKLYQKHQPFTCTVEVKNGTAEFDIPHYLTHKKVSSWVSPVNHFGIGYALVDTQKITVFATLDGYYNVLIIESH